MLRSSGSDVIYMGSFEEKTETANMFLPSDVAPGTYTFFVQLAHGSYKPESHRTVEVIEGVMFSPIGICGMRPLEVFAVIVLIILILLLIAYLGRKNIRLENTTEKILMKRYGILIIASLILLIILIIFVRKRYMGNEGQKPQITPGVGSIFILENGRGLQFGASFSLHARKKLFFVRL